jgi:hypothetical protein
MSYLWICKGLELFDRPGNMSGYENIAPSPDIYKNIIDEQVHNAIDHKTFLSSL